MCAWEMDTKGSKRIAVIKKPRISAKHEVFSEFALFFASLTRVRARLEKAHPGDFTRYSVRTSTRALFWQDLFIIVIKIRGNTPSQHLILANFYAKGVPNSAI